MIISLQTNNNKEIIDLTDLINLKIKDFKIKSGIIFISVLHTTAAITTADLDPGTDLDMLDAFQYMIPKLKYRHPHNPSHVSDHILSSLIGTSLALHIENNKLVLGVWQRVVLIELDGPRQRDISLKFIKD
ncbi:MAG: secondary thiamine-phosphate synthase enzyme YjbQ [bacterium]|nr:secondary thiamine-phosphate synthase enzyme YjbQ [Patescibacteria group bacterium]MDW8280024.1 secondary thiamine-phosphate synthase enzyme YjbQ [bacterium]